VLMFIFDKESPPVKIYPSVSALYTVIGTSEVRSRRQ